VCPVLLCLLHILPIKIRMLVVNEEACQTARGCMLLDTSDATTSNGNRARSCLQACAAIAADMRPQPHTHITGCCVRMSVTLGRCTSWGY
jgi:hypothetical protein